MVVLFWAALSHRVYSRTLPAGVIDQFFGESANEGPLAVSVLLRKLYSIVAFTIIAFVVHKALPGTRRPALRAAALVATFSALIEVVQKLHHADESLASEALDVACGALGGWLGATLTRAKQR